MPPGSRWRTWLFTPVDGASLAVFRIGFGALMLFEMQAYLFSGDVYWQYIAPTFHFTYPGFHWVKPWPGWGMYAHFWVLAALAICVMVGWQYRLATVLFFVGWTYVFLLEATQYLNHFYLICLFSLLLIFLPAHRVWSVDAWRRPGSPFIPAWCYGLLRAQIGLVYFYAGVAKINPDWLRGEPLRMWLADLSHRPVVGPLLREEWLVMLFSYGGLLLDLFIAPLLLWRRTRFAALVLVSLFHLTNATVFGIGIFPWLMLMTTGLFFEGDWPRRLVRRAVPAAPRQPFPYSAGVVRWAGAYLAIQILLPLRHFAYPGEVSWTEEGHRFSWHMKLRTKEATAVFWATDRDTGRTWRVNPEEYLLQRQFSRMSTRPDLIRQFARHIANEQRRFGRSNVAVRAEVKASLNGRPPQWLIDPNVNLVTQQWDWRPATWIVPLRDNPAADPQP